MTNPWPSLIVGRGVLRITADGWRDFAVVTTPSPWSMAGPLMPRPKAVVIARDLQRSSLSKMCEQVRGAEMIVGIGSGISMDAAKYLAKAEGAALAQVLTTSSNNACFTRTAWTFDGPARVAERGIPIPRHLVLDLDLLERAPAQLNRSGAAEILCSQTALFDWRLAHLAGVDVQWDEALRASTQAELNRLDDYAAAIGENDLDAFVRIIEVGAFFAAGFTSHPRARFNAGSEHVLAWALEELGGARLIHGEAVSLSILLMAHMQSNDPGRAARIIRAAGIRYRPHDLGLTWDTVERIMLQLPGYARTIPWHTIVTELEDGRTHSPNELIRRFRAARAFIDHLG